jgi:hypothetical protein
MSLTDFLVFCAIGAVVVATVFILGAIDEFRNELANDIAGVLPPQDAAGALWNAATAETINESADAIRRYAEQPRTCGGPYHYAGGIPKGPCRYCGDGWYVMDNANRYGYPRETSIGRMPSDETIGDN